jgi:hypothetical protein
MPAALRGALGAGLILSCLSLPAYEAPSAPAPQPFRYDRDSFAFANETVWNYVGGSVKPENEFQRKRDYTRRCFVVSRAAVQFWKFARFDSAAPPLSRDQLSTRVREVTTRDVWKPPLPASERVVFPGFASLRTFSQAEPSLLQENIGLGWPVYFRVGNAPIAAPVYRETEAHLNEEILRDLQADYPTIVWLYNFPSLDINHVVVVFGGERVGTHVHYRVYDPNYTDGPKKLDYDSSTRTFSYQPTFYYKGGPVQARAIYRGVLQ